MNLLLVLNALLVLPVYLEHVWMVVVEVCGCARMGVDQGSFVL